MMKERKDFSDTLAVFIIFMATTYTLKCQNGNGNVLDVAKVSELFTSVFSALNSPREEALPTLKMVQALVKCSL